jgi:hypothetical protein
MAETGPEQDTWYAVYEERTGRLVSIGTVLPDTLPPGLTSKEIAAQPRDDQMWDEVVQDLVDRPPPVVGDRIADFEADGNWPDIGLDRDKAREVLERLLPEEYRYY